MKTVFNTLRNKLIDFSNTKIGVLTFAITAFYMFFVIRDLILYILLFIFKLEL